MSEITVLYIEDNEPNVIVVARIIEHLGYRLLVANNATDGLSLAFQEKPDLILMDISLPDIDGLTATRQIRQDSEIGAVPIIAVTAHAMVGDRERCLEAGCTEYIQKPIVLKTLVTVVNDCLRERLGIK